MLGTLIAACDAAAPPASSTADLAAPSCKRHAVAHSAPITLLDTFAALPVAERAAAIPRFLAEVARAGGTPFEDARSGRVVFLARGPGPWEARGSFSGWDSGVRLYPFDGTDLWVGETTIPSGKSFAYKLVSGSRYVEDPNARNVAWDGIDRGFAVRGEMNAIGHAGDAPADKGRLVALGMQHASKLGDDREVWVHYPAAYDGETCRKLPSIVIHDGLESLTRGGFAEKADALYAAHPELAAVLVFVGLPSAEVRMAQYTVLSSGARGADYVDFLASDLWPTVTKEARLCSAASARGISGASLGGLVSTYAAFERPDQWGWIGAQSASYFWSVNAMIDRVATASPRPPLRIYLDSGCPEDNCGPTDQMDALLTEKGYDHVRIKEEGGQHDWPYWRDRLPGLLTHFRAGQTACDP